MRYIKLIVLSTVFSLSYGDIYKADTCNTPDGKDGECIHINKCRSLWPRAYQQELSNNFDFLRRSQCGNGQYMYCCPLKPKVECYTPDGRPGNCILYSTYIFQHEDTKFLMDSKCDTSELKFCYSALPRKVSNSNNCSQNDLVPDQNSNCCGIDASDANRIIGGSVARLGEYPWLALINYADTRELCAGVLISQLYVLTAAHCVNKDRENIPVSVVLGEHDRSTSIDCITFGNVQDCAEPTVTIMISHVTVHPEYNPSSSNKRNDIALIRLEDMAPYTEFIRPICLPLGLYDIHFSTQGRNKLWTAGWGNYDARHFRRSQVKLKVDLPYVDTAECANIYAESNFPITLWNKQVCAGGASGKDTCGGDSGGPLMMENESGKFELVGIVSFGMRMCGADRIPGVYTNVFKYMPWIRSVVRPYDRYD